MIPKKVLISPFFWMAVLYPTDTNTLAEIPSGFSGCELFLFAAHIRLSGQQHVLFTIWYTNTGLHLERCLKKTVGAANNLPREEGYSPPTQVFPRSMRL